MQYCIVLVNNFNIFRVKPEPPPPGTVREQVKFSGVLSKRLKIDQLKLNGNERQACCLEFL